MSLARIKTLYCVAVIAIAIVLDCTGEIVGWATAVVMLAGALPVFHLVISATLNAVEDRSCAHANRAKTHEGELRGHDRRDTLPEAPQ